MRWPIVCLGLLLVPAIASAHGLFAECKIEADIVRVSAYFDDDTDAAGAKVRVLDADKRVHAEGMTDEKGKWSFPRPTAGKYRVEVDAGAGHRHAVTLTIPADPGDVPATDAPSREENTQFPWRKLALGLGIITIAAVGLRWSLRKRGRGNGDAA